MISTYRSIGKILMQKDGFKNMPFAEQKKYIIRQYCVESASFIYMEKNEEKHGRIVMMNLDTKDKKITFSSGVQIDDDVCTQYLIFKNYAPHDPNIYATHTGYKSIFSFELLEYMQKNRKKIQWSEPNKVDTTIDYLKNIRNDFFVEDQAGIKPNIRLLSDEQQKGYPDAEKVDSLQGISDVKDYKKKRDKATKAYFEKNLAAITGARQAFAITINGRYMHEIEEITACYLDVLYYYIFNKQFAESKHKGCCHVCSVHGKLSKEVALKQKFYGTTNPYFFDNSSVDRSKYAFSMCEACYREVTVGMQYSGTKLKSYLLGLSCLVLPELDAVTASDEVLIDPNNMQAIVKLLRRRGSKEHEDNLGLVTKLQSRLHNFSLFFYYKPSPTSQEFIINRYIKGISISSLVEKTNDLDTLTQHNHLGDVFHLDYGLSFEGLRYLILPSTESHPNLKSSDYQKINRDILGLLSTYLYSQIFDFNQLVRRFVEVVSRKFNHIEDSAQTNLGLSPYLISIILKHLVNFNQLRVINLKEEKTMTTKLENPEILEYFRNNSEIYGNNYHAQGLFILGSYISDIEEEQRKKGINRTAIHKINLRGIPLPKVKSVMATMDDLCQIWETFNDHITDAYYRECMTDIEMSSLSPEVVVFHILSGRAYNTYLRILKGKEKKQNEQRNQEDQND